jgi:mono/diheme cytochrome c family protein
VGGQSVFSVENIGRIERLLPEAGFPDGTPLDEIATVATLRQGRDVLLRQCVQCHDLRTILLRPRMPEDWVRTVVRMAERSQLWDPIEEREQWAVAAYLIAITPDLQRSVKQKREQEKIGKEARMAVEEASKQKREQEKIGEPIRRTVEATSSEASVGTPVEPKTTAPPSIDVALAQRTFEATCSQCHETSEVENAPPTSTEEVRVLVARMVENGLSAPEEDIDMIIAYLTETYGKN